MITEQCLKTVTVSVNSSDGYELLFNSLYLQIRSFGGPKFNILIRLFYHCVSLGVIFVYVCMQQFLLFQKNLQSQNLKSPFRLRYLPNLCCPTQQQSNQAKPTVLFLKKFQMFGEGATLPSLTSASCQGCICKNLFIKVGQRLRDVYFVSTENQFF